MTKVLQPQKTVTKVAFTMWKPMSTEARANTSADSDVALIRSMASALRPAKRLELYRPSILKMPFQIHNITKKTTKFCTLILSDRNSPNDISPCALATGKAATPKETTRRSRSNPLVNFVRVRRPTISIAASLHGKD